MTTAAKRSYATAGDRADTFWIRQFGTSKRMAAAFQLHQRTTQRWREGDPAGLPKKVLNLLTRLAEDERLDPFALIGACISIIYRVRVRLYSDTALLERYLDVCGEEAVREGAVNPLQLALRTNPSCAPSLRSISKEAPLQGVLLLELGVLAAEIERRAEL